MKLFPNINSIVAEISDMERDEFKRREDRATVSAFFNGKPPYTQAEADALGLQCNVNNLFGYTDLASAKEAMLALYTKPARLWMVELDSAPVGKKLEWEQGIAQEFNRAVKKTGRLKMPYEGAAGDATLHGEGDFYFPDCRCPIPRHLPLSKRLIPNNASADPGELTHFAITTELTVHEIMFHIRRKSYGWNIGALQKLITELLGDKNKDQQAQPQNYSSSTSTVDSMNPEEMEYSRQKQGDMDRIMRMNVPVHYFFQADPEKDGRPLDLTIIPRLNRNADSGDTLKAESLFDEEAYYPSVADALHPFFMDCVLGGTPMWHRIKGLGHINYSLSWHIEVLMDRLMQAAMEGSQTWWQASDSATREDLEKILLRHNGIIPEGLKVMPERTPQNLNEVMSVIGLYRQQAARNGRSAFSNDESSGQGNELQVQAMFRQNAITAQQSSRLSNWYDAKSRLGATMLGRYANTDISPDDRYFSEIMEFQSALKRRGIPLYYVQPWNVNVTATRITGDGDDMKAKQAASFFMANMQMYPPESQQKLKRIVTGIVGDDYALAEDLVPIEDKPPAEQTRVADGENNTAIVQGRPPALAASDIDEAHVETHLQGLQAILQKAGMRKEEAFQPEELMAFKALGAHAIAHIQRMKSMGKDQLAAKYMQATQGLSQMADKLAHNLQQQQDAQQQPPVDPIKVAQLQLAHDQLQLKAQKDEFAKEKFQRTQSLREHDTAIKESTHLAADARAEAAHKAKMAESDTRLALDIASHAKENALPAPTV